MLIRSEESYHVFVGNIVLSSRVADMSSRLERLKQANDEELKLMHRMSLKGNEISDKGGAGLGLIDMARKVSEIDYLFAEINSERQFYLLKLKLTRKV